MNFSPRLRLLVVLIWTFSTHPHSAFVVALNVVLAGGTGPVGASLGSRLDAKDHDVTVLTRNAFLAATPARVTEQFGWLGEGYLRHHPNIRLRDWDGGDLLDIVGKDWIGWQDDALPGADVVIHLVGGFTEQRVMACERLVRECLAVKNSDALHVTVSPTDEDLPAFSPGLSSVKKQRIETCEDMVKTNCPNSECIRIEAFRLEQGTDDIMAVLDAWEKQQQGTS